MMQKERQIYSECPLCSGKDIVPICEADWTQHPLFAKTGGQLSSLMTWVQCRNCGHQFTEGYFTTEAFSLLMAETNDGQVVNRNFEAQRAVASRMIEKVLPHANHGLWLDVGFGNGALLMAAKEYGFDVVGCDLRESVVTALRAAHIEAHCKDLTQLKLIQKCAVISMADVLEHMPFPKIGLRAAHALLQKKGILLLSMPNIESPVWDLLDQTKSNPYWMEVEHYHNFSRKRLFALLEELGFRPLRYGISERYRVCMEVVAQKL